MSTGLTNSLMASNGMGASTMNTSSFANAKHDSVFRLLSGCTREEGKFCIKLLKADPAGADMIKIISGANFKFKCK